MNIQECRRFLQDKDYLTQTIVPLYQQEEDKLKFARLKILHLFFETGIQKNYDVAYLDTLCSLIDKVCSGIFQYQVVPSDETLTHDIARLLHFALLNDLEDFLVNLRFYEVIFSVLEEYEVCANIAGLQQKVMVEIAHKAAA